MFELSPDNAAEYLGYPCSVTPLGGGVSNTVLLIETDSARFVLKQSLHKLRVEEDWFSDRSRIFRECSAIRSLARVLYPGAVPEILSEDLENHLFAMTAAPAAAQPWKEQLMAGQIDPHTATVAGDILGLSIASTWNNGSAESAFGDQTIFEQLRIDPYYRAAATRNPDLAPAIEALIEKSGTRRVSLVHGDWSPKNLLVSGNSVMAIDFEAVHYGDPSFDIAFLLNHLLLKTFFRPQDARAYRTCANHFTTAVLARLHEQPDWLIPAAIEHLGVLLLARIDGKSPAEYITAGDQKAQIRAFARQLIGDPPPAVDNVYRLAHDALLEHPRPA